MPRLASWSFVSSISRPRLLNDLRGVESSVLSLSKCGKSLLRLISSLASYFMPLLTGVERIAQTVGDILPCLSLDVLKLLFVLDAWCVRVFRINDCATSVKLMEPVNRNVSILKRRPYVSAHTYAVINRLPLPTLAHALGGMSC